MNQNGGAQAVVRGDGAPGPTVATALATSTKNDTSVHRRSQGGPPIEMLPMIKTSQKDYCFFSFSFFWHLCVQQYKRTTVINYNSDPRCPGPPQFNFGQPTQMGPLQ